jgi:hypothetical protein
MQLFVDQKLARHTFANAPTIDTIVFHAGVPCVPVRIETFDYGTPMGWGNHPNVASTGGDIRRRVFVDGSLIPMFKEKILDRKRPAWLPKKIKIAAWNQLVSTTLI